MCHAEKGMISLVTQHTKKGGDFSAGSLVLDKLS